MAPPKRVCLITNESSAPKALVDRCIMDAVSREVLIRLGDGWGMEDVVQQSLGNKVTLRADWEVLLRENCWTIVPLISRLTSIISKLVDCKSQRINRPWSNICPPPIPYRFELVSLSLGNHSIIRSEGNDAPPTIFPPPYTELPSFQSTGLHPYFVIAAAWDAFNNSKECLRDSKSIVTYSLLRTITELWRELKEFPMEGAESRGEEGTLQDSQAIVSEMPVESATKRKVPGEFDGSPAPSKVAKSSPRESTARIQLKRP
ncbi:hypothetical protein DENSPDRAFT_840339 [Dentipellis sp. KUC8613]|nr:hypothetical protein DENSPDRAFT_840339 [Dentipellis sp. KUC8613]